MSKHKVCMVGATGVGKTSLVARFVSSIFSERYQTTIGVRIQTREVVRAGRRVTLVIWDLSGEDEFQSVRTAYLRGASGYLLVADGTRRETVHTAVQLQDKVRAAVGDVPFVLVLNKSDLVAHWTLGAREMQPLERRGWTIRRTSAKTGDGLSEVFEQLTEAMVAREERSWI